MAIQTNKRIKANLKFRMLLIFLSLSVVFWMLINLSKTYTSDVVFNVKYINLPVDKVIQNEPINQINATITSTGFSLLRYKLRKKNILLNISNLAYKKRGEYYYLPNSHLYELKTQLNVETIIDRIDQDTIFVNLGMNITKKIPIELKADIQYKLGYNLVGEFQISPNFITVIGPEAQLDTISTIKTTLLKLLDVSVDINEEIDLTTPNSTSITLSETKVLLTAKIDKFTEGTLTVPFKVLNVPRNYNITTFPSEVKVVYQVGLSNFNKITVENFEISCDFKQSQENDLNYLIPVLEETSSLVTNVRIVPSKIEFLIEE